MGDYIVKIAPDREDFIIWSSIVEAPKWFGNREELIEHLGDIEGECPTCHNRVAPGDTTRERIKRADLNGSSGYDRTWWWDESEIYAQLGVLHREHLGTVTALLAGGAPMDDERIRIHLEPFDDDEAVSER